MFEINNISYAIGSKTLVKDISFSLKPKHFFGLLGANGAGKLGIRIDREHSFASTVNAYSHAVNIDSHPS